jgi:hypothetical protein
MCIAHHHHHHRWFWQFQWFMANINNYSFPHHADFSITCASYSLIVPNTFHSPSFQNILCLCLHNCDSVLGRVNSFPFNDALSSYNYTSLNDRMLVNKNRERHWLNQGTNTVPPSTTEQTTINLTQNVQNTYRDSLHQPSPVYALPNIINGYSCGCMDEVIAPFTLKLGTKRWFTFGEGVLGSQLAPETVWMIWRTELLPLPGMKPWIAHPVF